MPGSNARRFLALGSLGILGALCAFLAGASAGAALNGRLNAVTVARVPVRTMQATIAKPVSPPIMTVARK